MAQPSQTHEDPQALARAQETWCSFMNITKYAIFAVIIVLVGLASAFVTF